MWNYEKRLQYPVNIKNPNGRTAQIIMSQYGGPNGKKGCFFSPLMIIKFFTNWLLF